jgi:hypothetical protein
MSAPLRRLVPIATALLLGACAETSSPPDTLTTPPVDGSLATVDQALTGQVWESFRVLGPRFTPAGAAALVAVGAAGHDGLSASSVPRLPAAVLGTTFVLDSVTLEYLPDSSRTGAPADGVRFILYAVNPLTGAPVPGAEIGHADLMDEGIGLPVGIALRLRVVSAGTTWLEYAVTAVSGDSAGGLQAAGFTHADGTRVDFRVGHRGGQAGDTTAAELEFAIGIPTRGFAATATLRNVNVASAQAGEVALDIVQDGTGIELTARSANGQIEAEFRVHGALLATAHGDAADPIILGPDQRPLPPAERETLHRVLGLVDQVFRMFDGLMRPVAAMLGGTG